MPADRSDHCGAPLSGRTRGLAVFPRPSGGPAGPWARAGRPHAASERARVRPGLPEGASAARCPKGSPP